MAAKILVCGANGRVGKELVFRLAHMGIEIRAAIHKRQNLDDIFHYKNVEKIWFDFNDLNSINSALEGISSLFILTPPISQQTKFISNILNVPNIRNISHILRLSMMGVNKTPVTQFARRHYEAEMLIINCGIPFTILRPNSFMQNLIFFFNYKENLVYQSLGDAKVSYIDIRDVADTAAEILLSAEKHLGKTYEITGPQAYSMYKIAEILSEVLGKKTKYQDTSEESMRELLQNQGTDQWYIDALIDQFRFLKSGAASEVTTGVEEITETFPINFVDFARDYSQAFRKMPTLL